MPNSPQTIFFCSFTSILPSIVRILTQLALHFLLCARLDIPSMFASMDSGAPSLSYCMFDWGLTRSFIAHGSFVAIVYEDHFNNNPIKLVFADQLAQGTSSSLLARLSCALFINLMLCSGSRRREDRFGLDWKAGAPTFSGAQSAYEAKVEACYFTCTLPCFAKREEGGPAPAARL